MSRRAEAGSPVGVRALVTLLAALLASGSAVAQDDGAAAALSCPPTPNCVTSDATDAVHAIAPLRLAVDPEQAWAALGALVDARPRFTVVRRGDGELVIEARTRLLRFVDDVVFRLRAEAGVIAMRSASRIGLSDLGANRRRLEGIRRELVASGILLAE